MIKMTDATGTHSAAPLDLNAAAHRVQVLDAVSLDADHRRQAVVALTIWKGSEPFT
jgi:hypothetical protein